MDEDNPRQSLTPKTPTGPFVPNGFPMRPRPQATPFASHPVHQNGVAAPQESVTTATPTPVSSAPTATTPPRSKKKKLLISLIAIAVALLVLVLTYVYWYQNPNKVVADGLNNALNAKSLTFTGLATTAGPTTMNVALDGGGSSEGATVNAKFTFDVQGKKYTLEGDGLTDSKRDLYFKVRNIDDLVKNYRSAVPTASLSLFDQIIAKVNDKWIKVSTNDLKNYSPDLARTQKCTVDAIKQLQNDTTTKSELMAAYQKHPFIAIDKQLGSKDGSVGYTLTTNQDMTKAFTSDYKNTRLYTTLKACDSGFAVTGDSLFGSSANHSQSTTFNVWVDQWTHHITKVEAKDTNVPSTTAVTLQPAFNIPVTITTPKDSTTLDQLQKDVQGLLQSTQTAPR